jgi:Rnl2 family RNA ligase
MSDAGWKYSSYEKIPESLNQLQLSESDYRLLKKVDWVVTEKIHGANFGITTDGVKVEFAKRKELLQAGEDFFGYLTKKAQLEAQAKEVFTILQAKAPDLQRVTIYGELFGGEYPHPDVIAVEGVQAVQTGVYYSPNIEYCAFDIGIINQNKNEYLDYDITLQVLREVGMMLAEPLFIGKFEQAFNYKIEFESTIPQTLKLPALPTNKAEGVVIKPVKSIYIDTKKGRIRPIVKKKISEFAEDNRFHQAQKWDSQQINVDVELLVTQEIFRFLTLNRLRNVVSKLGRITVDKNNKDKQLSLLVELLIWDILDSFNDTEYETHFNNLSNESQQVIMKKLEDAACKLVEEYYELFQVP